MARIMVVDDSIIMRKNLKIMLTEGKHTVIAEASNGFQAYNEYEKFRPDIVTMDISMPGLNGIEAVQRIMNDFPDAKIVMISALDQRSMVLEALQKGAKNYIIKPVTADKMLTVIDKILLDNRNE